MVPTLCEGKDENNPHSSQEDELKEEFGVPAISSDYMEQKSAKEVSREEEKEHQY